MQKLYHGAEAIITRENNVLKKERIKKGYRIEKLDSAIREKRTRLEARLLREARRSGVMTPQVFEEDKFTLRMEFVDGARLKDIIDGKNYRNIAKKIGEKIAVLHNYNIIHGDLTTSNMIMKARGNDDPTSTLSNKKPKNGKKDTSDNFDLYFIDFGLGFFSSRIEDKATDIHLLKEALESTHFDVLDKMWKIIVDAYKGGYHDGEKVIKTLSKIEKRGRYAER